MIARTHDAAFLNAVGNHPDVRPWLGGEGEADFTEVIANPENVALVAPTGGFVLVKVAPGIYDGHSLFLPTGRHRTVQAMREALAWMFEREGAMEITTTVPCPNRAASALTKLAGFQPVGFRRRAWPTIGGPDGVTWYALLRDDWMARQACHTSEEISCQP